MSAHLHVPQLGQAMLELVGAHHRRVHAAHLGRQVEPPRRVVRLLLLEGARAHLDVHHAGLVKVG